MNNREVITETITTIVEVITIVVVNSITTEEVEEEKPYDLHATKKIT